MDHKKAVYISYNTEPHTAASLLVREICTICIDHQWLKKNLKCSLLNQTAQLWLIVAVKLLNVAFLFNRACQ